MAGALRAARRTLGRRGAALLLVLLLGALLALRLPRAARTAADFPRHSPAALAHFLADFSNYPLLYSHITGPWQLEEESSNYTCWRYAVSYSCGAGCAGRAELLTCVEPERHRVRLHDRRCWRAPALAWPQLCESMEADSVVTARAGGGARLDEHARAQCGALALAAGGCDVRGARVAHHGRLRAALPRSH